MKVSAVINARNEQDNLPETLEALRKQTLKLHTIIVVNDGSTDKTAQIARQYGCTVIDLPFHIENYAGTPKIAEAMNKGLKLIRDPLPDFFMHLGADHVLPVDYVEKIVSRMLADPKIVIATGRIEGEHSIPESPRGSGRLIQAKFWQKVSNAQYPVAYCWEEWVCYKALQMGFKIRCFLDITSKVNRRTFGERGNEGKTMYALGYNWGHVLGKCLVAFKKSPKTGLKIFWGWFRHKGVERMPIADFVNGLQKGSFGNRVKRYLWRER